MARYGVIVCPKCREHAQIIELAATKTIRCQKCSSKLPKQKLRLFFSSDELAEAISVRTQIQAKLHDKNVDMETVLNGAGIKNAFDDAQETELSMSDFVDNREKVKPKKSPRKIILELLRSNYGSMEIDMLKERAAENGIEYEKFETMLERMLDSGEIYSPSVKMVQLV